MDSSESYSKSVIIKWIAGSFLLGSVVAPLLDNVSGLWFEYHSGLFLKNPEDQNILNYFFIFAVFFIRFSLIVSTISLILCFFFIHLKVLFVREEYASPALLFVTSSILFASLSSLVQLMPWNKNLWNDINSIPLQKANWSEPVLLGFIWLILNYLVISAYSKWDGQISKDEFEKRQKKQDYISIWSFFLDGYKQFIRFITFSSPLERYQEVSSHQLKTQLSPVSESLAWREQAKNLVSLKNPSFDFDAENSWRSSQEIWVGENIDTNELIFLCPRHEQIEKKEIENICQFADKISNEKGTKISKIIIAIKEKTYYKILKQGFIIEYISEDILLRDLIDFRDYLGELKQIIEQDKLPSSNLTLKDVYVESRIAELDNTSIAQNIEEYLNNWLNDPRQRHIALFGEHGQGKSTAMLVWAYNNLSKYETQRFPILIKLDGKSLRNIDFSKILDDWGSKYKINGQALMKLHEKGKLVLIFEGFDEMSLVDDSKMKLKDFKSLRQFANPKSKIIVTGRANFFRDKYELRDAFGIGNITPLGTDEPYFETIKLLPFDIDQISIALRKQDGVTKDDIIRQIKDKPNSQFFELVRRPSLLHIISTFWTDNFSKQSDNLNLARVMDFYINHSYTRKDNKENRSSNYKRLSNNQRCYFMTGIATLLSSRNSDQINITELSKITGKLIKNIPDSLPNARSRFKNESEITLREKRGKGFTHAHIEDDIRTCCLLVEDKSGNDVFCFSHPLIKEFLFAEVVVSQLLNPDLATNSIMRATNSKIDSILDLPNSMEFLGEIALRELRETDKNVDISISKKGSGSSKRESQFIVVTMQK